ncbi:hypothetical protein GCM10011380_35650 [Sphingomonas metalli]|uniref:Uncharacterized protein n=1 Tax=Sphingomonas metalli TaxID=1779358 RepID=A0A916TFL4_9SPHN|nr:hypothetical protein GCM10011380_35650 [Sphingomonas metalli]
MAADASGRSNSQELAVFSGFSWILERPKRAQVAEREGFEPWVLRRLFRHCLGHRLKSECPLWCPPPSVDWCPAAGHMKLLFGWLVGLIVAGVGSARFVAFCLKLKL